MPLAAPPPKSNRFETPLNLRRTHWVRPELVCEVTFLTWTADRLQRRVTYQVLRQDKLAIEVRRTVPALRPDCGHRAASGRTVSDLDLDEHRNLIPSVVADPRFEPTRRRPGMTNLTEGASPISVHQKRLKPCFADQ
jgi:hypothetical protein